MKLWHYTVFLVVIIGFVTAFFYTTGPNKDDDCPINTICIEIEDYQETNCSLYDDLYYSNKTWTAEEVAAEFSNVTEYNGIKK